MWCRIGNEYLWLPGTVLTQGEHLCLTWNQTMLLRGKSERKCIQDELVNFLFLFYNNRLIYFFVVIKCYCLLLIFLFMASLTSSLVSVAQTSIALLASTIKTRKCIVSNFSANNITVASGTAVASTGIIIPANASHTFSTADLAITGRQYLPALNAISATGTNAVGVSYYGE